MELNFISDLLKNSRRDDKADVTDGPVLLSLSLMCGGAMTFTAQALGQTCAYPEAPPTPNNYHT